MAFPTWFTQSAANPGRIIRLKEMQKPVTQSPMVQAAARRQLSARRSEMPRQGDGSWSRFFWGGDFRSFPKDQDKRWIFFLGIIYGPMVSGKFSVGLWFPVFGGRLLIFPRPIGSKSAPRTAGICWRASTMGARLPTITSPHPLSPQNNHHGSKMAMFSLAMGPNWLPQSLHH